MATRAGVSDNGGRAPRALLRPGGWDDQQDRRCQHRCIPGPVRTFHGNSSPSECEEYAEPERIIVAGIATHTVDVVADAVERQEAPILCHKLDVLRDLAIHLEVVTGRFRRSCDLRSEEDTS